MDNIRPIITNLEELKQEEARLKDLLQMKRRVIQEDLRVLKEEIQPVVKVAKIVGKIMSPQDQKHFVAQTGANITIDWLARKLFPKSNFLMQTLVPRIVKNYTSHYVSKAVESAAPALRKIGTKLTESARKNGKP